MKLSDLRPCDNCGGKIAPLFYVVRYSIAVIKPGAVNTNLGLAQMFGGHLGLAEMMSPEPDVVTVAMDHPEHNPLTVELFICNECYVQPVCLAEVAERRAARSGGG